MHYAGDVHCKSARRPGSDAFDLTFHLIDQNGSCYRFRDCDATGKFAPGKTQGFLRSKLAVARFLERDGASGADAAERDAAESAVPAAETSKRNRSEAEPAAAGREKRAKTAEVDATPATLPAAANGEGANVANVANVPLDLSEQEEAGIRVELSASLKREMITQWERVTLQGELLSLPRSVTAAEVLRRFEAAAKKKARSAEQAELAADCAAGLEAYFDGALSSSLLYAEEHAQAEAALVSHKNTKRREPSEVYGAEHLLRLFVKLPERDAAAGHGRGRREGWCEDEAHGIRALDAAECLRALRFRRVRRRASGGGGKGGRGDGCDLSHTTKVRARFFSIRRATNVTDATLKY